MNTEENPFKNYHNYELNFGHDMTFEERVKAVREIGKKSEENFKSKYETINHWFTDDYDQLYILSFCLRYFLLSEEGYDEEAATGSLSFAPHYLEILQALSLTHERNYSARPLMNNVEKLKSDMKDIGTLIQTKLLNIPLDIKTEKDITTYRIRTDVMGYNMAVRNWAYYHQMQTVMGEMAKLVQDEFIKAHNVCPLAFINLLFTLSAKIEERINNHLNKLQSSLSKKDYLSIQTEYENVFERVTKSTIENKEHMWEMAGKDLTELRALLLAHSDLRLQQLFAFTPDEMANYSDGKLSVESINYLFSKLTYSFSDLKDCEKNYIILDNPTHNRPFINTEDGYFSSLWTSIPHLSLSMLEYLVQENETLRERYNIQRAKYLESEIEILFRKSFPNAEIHKGSEWIGADGKKYENDLIVLIDTFAIVVEAKSGIMTKPAKRGAPDRLAKTIKELIEEPSEQALRFIEYLKTNKGELSLQTKTGCNKINAESINYFIPLGVTFYHLGVLGTNLKLLVKSGMTNKNIHELAPSISLTDLQIVFELLTTEAQKIHYFQRRRELEMQVEYFADELDLLGFYLDTSFDIGDMEGEGKAALNLTLKSKDLDPYIIGTAKGSSVKKPELKMTTWWKDILATMAKRKTKRWLEFSYILLNIHVENQRGLERQFKELVQRIKNNEIELEHNWVVFLTANKNRQFAIVAYPYKSKHLEERNKIFSEIINQAFDVNKNLKGVVVIGVNIDTEHYPYSALAGDLAENLLDNRFTTMSSFNNKGNDAY